VAAFPCAALHDCVLQLRNLATNLSASKADSSSLLQHQQHCQQQLLELQRGLAAAQSAASEAAIAAAVAKTALEPIDSLRLQLADTQGTVGALQATAAGAALQRLKVEQQGPETGQAVLSACTTAIAALPCLRMLGLQSFHNNGMLLSVCPCHRPRGSHK